ncbi:Methylthioribulose-1-phosphate dehydratase [Myriangium duriaei CBS 260.36]|uniref:Methylthioribulose-1-phosphate dehydratase n=1 Tax=Myriangium duriaei CBS 260.36 TaxID=1168546 RepID=A0A9P4J7B2_9PEZI|nr:Methylthioribulose-1-phosphate dehydratase [Myriangium duriaei CBS 260.36]
MAALEQHADALVTSDDPQHPANLICELCRKFYTLGWVTGTGGGTSIRKDDKLFIAPSGVQKELMRPGDMFVMDFESKEYLRRPPVLKPSACTPLFLAAFTLRNAECCIHTHSQWAVLVTLLCERKASESNVFAISTLEQIKGVPRGYGPEKKGNLGYYDTLKIPIIENTPHEEDLKDTLEQAIQDWPDAHAVLVKRHGIYVWGKDVAQAKTLCESLDYIFQLAVEMHKLGLPWVKE